MKTLVSITLTIATAALLASCTKDRVEPEIAEAASTNNRPEVSSASSFDAVASTAAQGILTGYVDAATTDDGGSSSLVIVIDAGDQPVLGCAQIDVDLVLANAERLPIATLTGVRPDTLYYILINDPALVQLIAAGDAEIRAGLPCGADGYTPLEPGNLYISDAADF